MSFVADKTFFALSAVLSTLPNHTSLFVNTTAHVLLFTLDTLPFIVAYHCHITKAVVAICVLFVPAAAVGAVGTPVKAGLARFAFPFNCVCTADVTHARYHNCVLVTLDTQTFHDASLTNALDAVRFDVVIVLAHHVIEACALALLKYKFQLSGTTAVLSVAHVLSHL